MSPVVAWVLALIHAIAPRPAVVPGIEETAAHREERLEEVAEDIAAAAFDPRSPPLPLGAHPRSRAAALLVAVAALESGFAADADLGPCSRHPVSRCDGGRAVSLWQLRVTYDQRDDLFASRRRAAALALERMRQSLWACSSSPAWDRLAVYASGSCARGVEASRARLGAGSRLFDAHPPPL